MIKKSDIKAGKQFKTKDGIIWNIDSLTEDKSMANTSMEGGEKGNYRDSIEEVVAFLNEEEAKPISPQQYPESYEELKLIAEYVGYTLRLGSKQNQYIVEDEKLNALGKNVSFASAKHIILKKYKSMKQQQEIKK